MKKAIITLSFLVGFGLTMSAQEAPSKVTEAFKTKFPNAKSVAWEKENDKEWEAEFKMDDVKYSANFSNEGKWKETEHVISKSELPNEVLKTLEDQFAGYEMKKGEISETSKGIKYEMKLVKGEEKKNVVIAADGTLIK